MVRFRNIFPAVNGGASHKAGLAELGGCRFAHRRSAGTATVPLLLFLCRSRFGRFGSDRTQSHSDFRDSEVPDYFASVGRKYALRAPETTDSSDLRTVRRFTPAVYGGILSPPIYEPGDVVYGADPFKGPETARPWLILQLEETTYTDISRTDNRCRACSSRSFS